MAPKPSCANILVYKDRFAYCSHPSVARLANGELIVACNENIRTERLMHPPNHPRYHNLLIRSRDNGQSWDLPRVLPGYDWYGVECPGILALRSGRTIVNSYRFAWYTLEAAQKLAAEQGMEFTIGAGPRQQFTVTPKNAAAWAQAGYSWARTHGGSYIHISDDGGRTWQESVELDVSPFTGGYSDHGGWQCADGTILLALGAYPYGKDAAFLISSRDEGLTWSRPVTVMQNKELGFYEPSVVQTPSGKIVVVARTSSGFIYQSDSRDGGRTWSAYRQTPMFGLPPHLQLLQDGRLLCTYGRRKEPFGIRVCISEDEGETWPSENEIVLRDDMPNGNLGYPTTIELADGRLFTVYYGEDADGVTFIQASIYRL